MFDPVDLSRRIQQVQELDEPETGAGDSSRLKFRIPSELAESRDTEWIVPGLIARGNVTELTGKVKVSGKTTWALTLIRAVLDGGEFIGNPCAYTPVIFLTEQGDSSFRDGLMRAGLLDRVDFHILSWHSVRKFAWPQIVADSARFAQDIGARIIVVDTLGRWTGTSGDAENSAGAAGDAMEPLKVASAEHNVAVLILRHGRKSGGDVGDDGRGSSAFSGDADILLSLRRPEGNHRNRPNVRELLGIGRFNGIPDRLIMELQGIRYVALGDDPAISERAAHDALQRVMPASTSDALTESEIIKRAGNNRSTIRRLITQQVKAGHVQRIGGGKRGDLHRYCWSSARTETERERCPPDTDH